MRGRGKFGEFAASRPRILQRPKDANSPGKAVIIKRASPGWEEALFIIGFALPYLLLAEEEGDHCQKQESGITGVASAAAAT